MTELLLIDLSSVAYPIWHVTASESPSNPNVASQQTVARVRALASSHPHAAICCDSGKSFRSEIDPEYKAQRDREKSAAIHHQIDLAMEALRADGFPVIAVKGFEADDLVATMARLARERNADDTVLICSSDKDLLALVGPRVKVKNLTSGDVFDAEAVHAKLGVWPEQITDYLSLVGDSSDNIDGAVGPRNPETGKRAPGIGPVKAREMLAALLDIEGIYKALDGGQQFKPATRACLLDFRPRLETVRSLVRMRDDVEIANFEDVFKPRVSKAAAQGFGMEDALKEQPDLFATEATPNPFAAKGQPVPDGPEAGPLPMATEAAPVTAKAPLVDATLEPAVPAGAVAVFKAAPAPAPQEWSMQLEPRSMPEAIKLAEWAFNSTFLSAYPNPQAALMVILAGREMGIQAQRALRAFHIIDNVPRPASDLLRAIIKASGKAKYFRCIERTATKATYETERVDDDYKHTLSFTIEEGRAAFTGTPEKWDKSGWKKNPADMCVARAGAKLGRLVYEDVVHGLYASEEFDQ